MTYYRERALRMDLVKMDNVGRSYDKSILKIPQTVGKFTNDVTVYVSRHPLFPEIGFISSIDVYRDEKQPRKSVDKMRDMAIDQVQSVYGWIPPKHYYVRSRFYNDTQQFQMAICVKSDDLVRVCQDSRARGIYIHREEKLVLEEFPYLRSQIDENTGIQDLLDRFHNTVNVYSELTMAYDENLAFYKVISRNIDQIAMYGDPLLGTDRLFVSEDEFPEYLKPDVFEQHRLIYNPNCWTDICENMCVEAYGVLYRVVKRDKQVVECIRDGENVQLTVSAVKPVEMMNEKMSLSYFAGNRDLVYLQRFQSEHYVEARLCNGWWESPVWEILPQRYVANMILSKVEDRPVRYIRGKVSPDEFASEEFQSMYRLTRTIRSENPFVLADVLYRLYRKSGDLEHIVECLARMVESKDESFEAIEELVAEA